MRKCLVDSHNCSSKLSITSEVNDSDYYWRKMSKGCDFWLTSNIEISQDGCKGQLPAVHLAMHSAINGHMFNCHCQIMSSVRYVICFVHMSYMQVSLFFYWSPCNIMWSDFQLFSILTKFALLNRLDIQLHHLKFWNHNSPILISGHSKYNSPNCVYPERTQYFYTAT